jgi:hypothetical protein
LPRLALGVFLLLPLFVVDLGQFVGAFDLMFEAIVLGGDIFAEDLGAANLPLFFDPLLSLGLEALENGARKRVEFCHDKPRRGDRLIAYRLIPLGR